VRICHMEMSDLKKKDHIICHDLENQEKNKHKIIWEIADQKNRIINIKKG